MPETTIKVERLSKQYRYGVIGHGTLYQDLQSWWARFRGREDPNARITEQSGPGVNGERFWALEDVSLEVSKGEKVGIIGRNGAGKSTLLKILSRVTTPTRGLVKLKGRIASLLEVGTGFHPEQTGRENIYLNGTILGMTKAEIRNKFDEIVEFSGLERFIDTPVKRYSSGMYVRLAFAVAAHLDSEIMLVDEVLAVGDVQFQKKCLGKMKDISGQGRTVLFVSHNMGAIRNLCERTLLLDSGRLVLDAPSDETIAHYLDRNLVKGAIVSSAEIEKRMQGVIRQTDPYIRFKEIALHDKSGVPKSSFDSNEDIIVSITFECLQPIHNLQSIVMVVDENNTPVLETHNIDNAKSASSSTHLNPGVYKALCVLPKNTFGGRVFFLTVHLLYAKTEHLVVNKILEFNVAFQGYNGVYAKTYDVFFRPRLNWIVRSVKT